jgi:hypothetical protein
MVEQDFSLLKVVLVEPPMVLVIMAVAEEKITDVAAAVQEMWVETQTKVRKMEDYNQARGLAAMV